MSSTQYKRNFVNKVISKIDFASPTDFFTPESLSEAISEIKKRFPVIEQNKASQQSIQLTPEGPLANKIDFPEWIFHGNNREKYLKVNKLFIEILLTKYTNENSFRDDLITPIQHLLKLNPKMLIQRTGVRFINIFDFPLSNFSDSTQYFDESISGIYHNSEGTDKITRSFLTTDYLFDDIKLRMQSGFFNPDYPSLIKRNHFVIDIDAYIDFPHLINDVTAYFNRLHDIIEAVFESKITDKLRTEVLNG